MVKNSFTLLEAVVSIMILSTVFIATLNHLKQNTSLDKINIKLNDIENSFDKKDYSNFNIENKTISIILDKETSKELSVRKYLDKEFEVFKYEK